MTEKRPADLPPKRRCRACGFAMEPDAERCPQCRTSRKENVRFWRVMLIGLFVSFLITGLTVLALNYYFPRLTAP